MTDRNRGVLREILARPGAFGLTFATLFLLTFVFLAAVGITPDPVRNSESSGTGSAQEVVRTSAEDPVRVVAKAIGLEIVVRNPDSTEISVLDAELLKGAVRYPTSAKLGAEGNMLLFGHSSYLPIVHNQNYKAFNKIQNLKTGDTVSLYSATAEYRYHVVGVREADAEEDVIELSSEGKKLTLLTCDSFGKKTDRFVVEADFVETYSLGN